MKASELMMGDWVLTPCSPTKVMHVRWDCILGSDGLRGLIDESELEPIPLTPEILEKNGFKMFNFRDIEGQHEWAWWNNAMTSVTLWCRELNDDPKDGWMIQIRSERSTLLITIEYVHQLQQALRLCGITKEIEL